MKPALSRARQRPFPSLLERMTAARERVNRVFVCADDSWTVEVSREALEELDRAIAQALLMANRAVRP